MKLSAKTYARLKDFAQKGGSLKNAGTVLGDTSPKTLKGYLLHMKKDAPDLHKRWASPAVEKPKVKEATAGLDNLFGDEPVKQEKPTIKIGGTDYEEKFRLRLEDGTDLKLEIFSKHPQHGFILVPREA